MIKRVTLFILISLSVLQISYANSYRFSNSFQIIDSSGVDSSQININVLKHSISLICYGKTVAYIDTLSGMIRDINKSKNGMFIPNGDIHDASGGLMGRIVGDQFMDATDVVIGVINSTGEVFDINNMKIGEINNSNEIIDANNSRIGEVEIAVNKKWLAAYFFFFFTI